MIKKFAQEVEFDEQRRMRISYDWYNNALPVNMVADEQVYFDTSYSFRSFHSEQPLGLSLGYASGNYGRSIITTGKNGVITIGKFVILEATNILCNLSVSIGDHCMLSWGSVITDSWLNTTGFSSDARRRMLEKAGTSKNRYMEFDDASAVTIEDNVWVGFDAVVLPGVTLGRGCVVGCKTVVGTDVPPYAVVAGSPPKVIKYLAPSDTPEEKQAALKQYLKAR